MRHGIMVSGEDQLIHQVTSGLPGHLQFSVGFFFSFFLSSLTPIFEPVLSQAGNLPKCSAKLD